MNTTPRLLLFSFALLVFATLAIGGTAWWWWSQQSEDFFETMDTTINDGSALGETTDTAGCLDEVLRRQAKSKNFNEAFNLQVFLSACLERAERIEGFCDNTPQTWKQKLGKATWAKDACAARGYSGVYCESTMQKVLEYCESL